MSWETATDTLIDALNELSFVDIEDVGIPADFPNETGTPKSYMSETRAHFDYGNQTYLDSPITSRGLNNLVVILHVDDEKDPLLDNLRKYYQDVITEVRSKIEEKEIDRTFRDDGDRGFSANLIDVQPNFDVRRVICWVWFVIEVRAFH
jgi:hypothetical protein